MPRPLLIADVPWLLYRSFFALPRSITGTDGRPVNALLGTVNAILSFFDEARLPARSPRGVVACMGAEQADYRVALYAPYHAHRDPMPRELAEQWQKAPALLESMGWTHAGSDTLEADDVMFSYALAEERAGGQALLLSGDRDLYGAVTESVRVVAEVGRGKERTEIGPAQVRERYGVDPAQVPDLIALRGDPSDGLPGAPGVGAKTAARLLAEHGTLEGVLAAAAARAAGQDLAGGAAMTPRIVTALCENAAQLRDFKLIATLQGFEVGVPPDRPNDHAAGAAAAAKLGMGRLAGRLERLAGGGA
jgi:DNA polymerase-1